MNAPSAVATLDALLDFFQAKTQDGLQFFTLIIPACILQPIAATRHQPKFSVPALSPEGFSALKHLVDSSLARLRSAGYAGVNPALVSLVERELDRDWAVSNPWKTGLRDLGFAEPWIWDAEKDQPQSENGDSSSTTYFDLHSPEEATSVLNAVFNPLADKSKHQLLVPEGHKTDSSWSPSVVACSGFFHAAMLRAATGRTTNERNREILLSVSGRLDSSFLQEGQQELTKAAIDKNLIIIAAMQGGVSMSNGEATAQFRGGRFLGFGANSSTSFRAGSSGSLAWINSSGKLSAFDTQGAISLEGDTVRGLRQMLVPARRNPHGCGGTIRVDFLFVDDSPWFFVDLHADVYAQAGFDELVPLCLSIPLGADAIIRAETPNGASQETRVRRAPKKVVLPWQLPSDWAGIPGYSWSIEENGEWLHIRLVQHGDSLALPLAWRLQADGKTLLLVPGGILHAHQDHNIALRMTFALYQSTSSVAPDMPKASSELFPHPYIVRKKN